MSSREEALADTVALAAVDGRTEDVFVDDPHVAVTVQRAALDAFEAPTRALSPVVAEAPQTVATTVWSPKQLPCAPTQVIGRRASPPVSRRRTRPVVMWIAAAFVALASIFAVGMTDRSKAPLRAAEDNAAPATVVVDKITVSDATPERRALSTEARADLERVAVAALLAGDSATARARYEELAALTGESVFEHVAQVLERTP